MRGIRGPRARARGYRLSPLRGSGVRHRERNSGSQHALPCFAALLLWGGHRGGGACGALLTGRMPVLRDAPSGAWEIPIENEAGFAMRAAVLLRRWCFGGSGCGSSAWGRVSGTPGQFPGPARWGCTGRTPHGQDARATWGRLRVGRQLDRELARKPKAGQGMGFIVPWMPFFGGFRGVGDQRGVVLKGKRKPLY
jgi:hypothetical protein